MIWSLFGSHCLRLDKHTKAASPSQTEKQASSRHTPLAAENYQEQDYNLRTLEQKERSTASSQKNLLHYRNESSSSVGSVGQSSRNPLSRLNTVRVVHDFECPSTYTNTELLVRGTYVIEQEIQNLNNFPMSAVSRRNLETAFWTGSFHESGLLWPGPKIKSIQDMRI